MVVPAFNNSVNSSEQKASFFVGFLFLGVCATGAWFAHDIWKNQSLFLMFGTFAGVALICLLYVLIVRSLIWIRIRRGGKLLKLNALCGQKRSTGVSILPTSLAFLANPTVSWTLFRKEAVPSSNRIVQFPIEVEAEGGLEKVKFGRRCHINFHSSSEFLLQRRVLVSDPLGMFVSTVSSEVKIHEVLIDSLDFEGTSLNRLRSIANTVGAKASATGEPQGDLTEMREYQEGDSIRFMLWKVLAKTGGQRKMVRTEERVESHRTALFFFPSRTPDDERAASFVKYYFRQRELSGDWVFGLSGHDEIFCRSNERAINKAIRAISRSGIDYISVEDSIKNLNKFCRDIRRLRIENPVVIVGGTKDPSDTAHLCESIKDKNRGCGILVVPAENEAPPFFWKEKT